MSPLIPHTAEFMIIERDCNIVTMVSVVFRVLALRMDMMSMSRHLLRFSPAP